MKPYFADLFAGSKRVARAAHSLGAEARTWELGDGPSNDLTCWEVESALHRDIEAGRVLGAAMAPPCKSFSIANNASGPIRSVRYPRGIPGLTGDRLARVREGNKTLNVTVRLIHSLGKHRVPFSLEQPIGSYMWCLPRGGSKSVV